jgi:cold shock CspA family protein
MSIKIENGVVTYTKLNDDWSSGFGFVKPDDGSEAVFFSSSAIYQNRGVPDFIEVNDIVRFERYEKNNFKSGIDRGPRARRVWLREKADSAHGQEQITTLHGENDT